MGVVAESMVARFGPLTLDHAPPPIIGVLPAIVALVPHNVYGGPAFAGVTELTAIG